jgi:hypothetical protein
MACHGMVRTYCTVWVTVGRHLRVQSHHVIKGEGPSSARRHQDGEFLGAGKRRVEGMEGKGEPSTGRRTRKADAHSPSPRAEKHGAGSMCAAEHSMGGIVPD